MGAMRACRRSSLDTASSQTDVDLPVPWNHAMRLVVALLGPMGCTGAAARQADDLPGQHRQLHRLPLRVTAILPRHTHPSLS